MIYKSGILITLLAIPHLLLGQAYTSHRVGFIKPVSDTITLDTLSIIPGSVTIYTPDNTELTSDSYWLNHTAAQLLLPSFTSEYDSLAVHYRVFPFLIDTSHQRREYAHYLSPDSLLGRDPPRYIMPRTQASPFGDDIKVSGSFMRGVSFGNNQDLSVTSGMNIQLSGELGDNLMIEGAISDQTVPLQPEGNTYHLQEFDRVYMRIYSDRSSLQAGDIDMRSQPADQLLTFSRSVQGLLYETEVYGDGAIDTLNVIAGGAVARGKFARNTLMGADGNQGPYRLQGAEGELYIIVIAGSERVFMDGVQLERGEDRDYTIDYNMGEVIFTPKIPITRHSRIVVEFEYSERSYARFNTYLSLNGKSNNWGWRLSAYSEQDSRNQPFEQDLTEDQKRLLASIGDNLDQAYLPQVDSIEFDPDMVLYRKVDTLVGGQPESIYIHSTNPLFAHYRVSFSFVGVGNGDYVPEYGSANGRVYRWVAPLNGIKQGSYAPVRKLITPKKRQMVSTGLQRSWGVDSGVELDYAISNNDLNTFSSLDSDDNVGHAVRVAAAQSIANTELGGKWAAGGSLMATTDGFRYIDRFRSQEFERDWAYDSYLEGGNEHQADVWLRYSIPQSLSVTAISEGLQVGNTYQGARGRLVGWQRSNALITDWDASIMNSMTETSSTSFVRAKAGITKPIAWLNIGLKSEVESRASTLQNSDSLLNNSFEWYKLKVFAAMHDTLPQRVGIEYSYREDFAPSLGERIFIGTSQEVNLRSAFDGGGAGNLQATVGYRLFDPAVDFDALTIDRQKESTLLGRVEYSNRFARGAWMLSAGYELGSGLEPENEYYFVEVPPGQGLYTWIDYNDNGVKELDEFEIASFADEARYIRVNVPGTSMVSVRTNTLSLRSTINPARLIDADNGLLALAKRVTNQTSFSARGKNTMDNLWQAANPFPAANLDTLIVNKSSSLRNSLAFNRNNRSFGVEYIHSQSNNRILQANGIEQRATESNMLITWVGLPQGFTIRAEGESAVSTNSSEFFSHRDFHIESLSPKGSIRRTTAKGYTAEVGYRWQQQNNTLGEESAISRTLHAQVDLMSPSKGSVMFKTSLVDIEYTGAVQSAVAYEMLKGLQPGRNAVWEVAVRRRLSQLFELEVSYNGRYLSNGWVVHTGSMMARALF